MGPQHRPLVWVPVWNFPVKEGKVLGGQVDRCKPGLFSPMPRLQKGAVFVGTTLPSWASPLGFLEQPSEVPGNPQE